MRHMEEKMQKLLWRCRRGTKELDILMMAFLENHYRNAEPALKHAFEAMLEMQDPELYALVTGGRKSHDHHINRVIEFIRT